MYAFTAICYIAAGACFLIAVTRPKIAPASLDLVALGLFLFTLPTIVEYIAHYG